MTESTVSLASAFDWTKIDLKSNICIRILLRKTDVMNEISNCLLKIDQEVGEMKYNIVDSRF